MLSNRWKCWSNITSNDITHHRLRMIFITSVLKSKHLIARADVNAYTILDFLLMLLTRTGWWDDVIECCHLDNISCVHRNHWLLDTVNHWNITLVWSMFCRSTFLNSRRWFKYSFWGPIFPIAAPWFCACSEWRPSPPHTATQCYPCFHVTIYARHSHGYESISYIWPLWTVDQALLLDLGMFHINHFL